MRQFSSETQHTGLSGPVSFGAGLLLLALAPLIRGGNRYVALIGLEWLGLLVLWLLVISFFLRPNLVAQDRDVALLSKGEWVLVLSPLWAALLFLTPLPMALWAALPGHALYLNVPGTAWRPLSLTPDATAASLLAGIPVVAAFVLARTAQPALFRLLPPTLVLGALLQAIWGLLQAGPFKELYFDAEFAGGLIGSFANSNHFANYIAMTLPLAVFTLWRSMPSSRTDQPQRPPVAAVLWSVVLLVLMAAALASGSRTGAITSVLVTLLAVLLLLGGMPSSSQRWYALGAGALLLAVLVIVGVNSLMVRFDTGRLGDAASFRWQLIASTWRAALAFWPTGSGPGSFASVYPQFQPPGLRAFIEHAHSDYVQLLMELGALFVGLAGLTASLIVRQAMALWRQVGATGGRFGLVQLCCGLGLLAVLLHSWVDFNLRIPANAVLAACLLGAFLRPCRSGS